MYQSRGLGYQLKLLQRERALSAGLDLVQWTYDPLQAMNAHLNFAKLGVVVEEYAVNIYGVSGSPLHGGNPDGSVRRRLVDSQAARRAPPRSRRGPSLRSSCAIKASPMPAASIAPGRRASGSSAPTSISRSTRAAWLSRSRWGSPTCCRRRRTSRWPGGCATREIFTTYFARGYRAVEFFLDRPSRKGAYLLVRQA